MRPAEKKGKIDIERKKESEIKGERKRCPVCQKFFYYK